MKRILAVILIVGLVLGLSAMTALADDPAHSFNVSGVIQVSEDGTVSGTLADGPDAPTVTLTIAGAVTDFADHTATLTGTVGGDIEGSLTATINDNGVTALSGEIIGTDVHLWITGVFPKSVADGQFVGKISPAPPAAYVESMTLGTATGGNTVEAGQTLQMTAAVEPGGASDKAAWSVRTEDGGGSAAIDADTGLLTGKQAGIVTVIAKALDGSLKDAEIQVTVTEAAAAAAQEEGPGEEGGEERVEKLSAAAPVYTIVIPGKVDFGKIRKGKDVKTQPFVMKATDVHIDGGEIQVRVDSTFRMSYKGQHLPYSLHNSKKEPVDDGDPFAVFTADGQEEKGTVGINTADITHSGNYTGIMTFVITYEK